MVGWALRFLIAAILATLVAYSGIGYGAAVVAKIIVVILLALCTVSLVAALRRGR
jgi:uncharacterized membrane protein YtjA (UPF0391 family)